MHFPPIFCLKHITEHQTNQFCLRCPPFWRRLCW
jgi:hypothetical protein